MRRKTKRAKATTKKTATIKLPPLATDRGAMSRLFIQESYGPGHHGKYNENESVECMRLMKIVLLNRSKHWRHFKAKSSKLIDIIRAPGQFVGFSRYPRILSSVSNNIRSILNVANANSTKNSDAREYGRFVLNAINVANEPVSEFNDPCPTGLYYWMKSGTENPCKSDVECPAYITVANTTFFTDTKILKI